VIGEPGEVEAQILALQALDRFADEAMQLDPAGMGSSS
jgi:hypothetical protein